MDIFVDTGAWYAIHDEDDKNHPAAIEYWTEIQQEGHRLITTDEVIQESASLIQGRLGKQVALDFLDQISAGNESGEIVKIPITEEIKSEAWDIFKGHTDKDYSFCDCTSFVVMRRYQYRDAFAFDPHFEQAGFTLVPEQVTA